MKYIYDTDYNYNPIYIKSIVEHNRINEKVTEIINRSFRDVPLKKTLQ